MRYKAALLVLAAAVLFPAAVAGQGTSWSTIGLPYFSEHFTPEEYQAYVQNWDITQDSRGFVYVANNRGILEYDGAAWRLIPTPSGTIVRSLATDPHGTIYVGVQGDMGYLQPDAKGVLGFVSLRHEVDSLQRDFKDVWGVQATEDAVYFQTRQWVFRWDGAEMRSWKTEGTFHNSFLVNGRLYVREQGRGLLEMGGDELRVAPAGDRLAKTPVFAMVPLDERRVLMGTMYDGLMLYDGTSFQPFETEADALFHEHWLYAGTSLGNGQFALATLGGGVAVIDSEGRLLRMLNEGSGLPDSEINAVYADGQGGLWLAFHSQGLMRMNVSPQLSLYDRRLGLEGFVEDILRHQGVLYVATSSGLFHLNESSSSVDGWRPSNFQRVPGIQEEVRTLVKAGDQLLAGTLNGIYLIYGGRATSCTEDTDQCTRDNTFRLHASKTFPGRVYAGTKNGLVALQRSETGWERHAIPAVESEVRSVVEEDGGRLWLATVSGDILRVTFDGERFSSPMVQRFGTTDGLPGDFVTLNVVGGSVRFASRQGIYKYEGVSDNLSNKLAFQLDSRFSTSSTAAQDTLLLSATDSSGNLWLGYTNRIDIVTEKDGSYPSISPDVLRFRKSGFQSLYVEPDGVAWLNDGDGLLRYDSRHDVPYDTPYATWVRRITLVGSDSLIFGGSFPASDSTGGIHQSDAFIPVLDFESNNLAIEFAAPSFNASDKNLYQYYLEGKDRGWSEWTSRTTAIYTNLPEGTYRFHVRALNAQGYVSTVGSFTFRRLPPWYRTWWAYGIYVLLLGALTFLLVHYRKVIKENRLAREQAEQLARERLANERLQEANMTLQEANERLQQADRLKDEFLTNTSHELRTPITAILGFTSILKEEVPGAFHEFLDIIDENSKRLLHTVSSLLDLAKLKAGVLDMKREPVDLTAEAGAVLRLLSPLAQRKGIYLNLIGPDQPVYALVDRQSYERILYNLVGNAIKFTEEGGVTVRVDQELSEARVQVEDTGIGMEHTFLPHLFEEFRQESTGLARAHEGSGLGLAITARLVQLMNGTINVESSKGEGSTFSVAFPATLPEEELLETASA